MNLVVSTLSTIHLLEKWDTDAAVDAGRRGKPVHGNADDVHLPA